jgi:small subunit ribosomal protein S1
LGDTIEVIVQRVDKEKRKIYASYRQAIENPWEMVEEKYPVGCRVKAKVVDFLPFGATVEMEGGFRALVHDSEVSWTERKSKARDCFRLGEIVDVAVQRIDKVKRKIYASYRQAIENPWATFLERFPAGTITSGKVIGIRDYGLFVMLPNGWVGLLHKNSFPTEDWSISLGDSVDAIILSYEQERQRISLGYCSPSD